MGVARSVSLAFFFFQFSLTKRHGKSWQNKREKRNGVCVCVGGEGAGAWRGLAGGGGCLNYYYYFFFPWRKEL